MPVLPPTAASTIASNVVGTWTTRTPRSHVAATKPPRSVVAPPPTATTASLRVRPAAPMDSQQPAATSAVLARSPGGTDSGTTSYAGPSTSLTRAACARRSSACTTATRRTAAPTSSGSRSRRSCPTTTSYGAVVRTSITVASAIEGVLDEGGHLVRRTTVGVHGHRRHRLVDRAPFLQQRLHGAPDVAEQERPRRAEPDTGRGGCQADP